MLETGQLLEQPRYHLARPLRLRMRIIETPEVGQSVRQSKGRFHARQRGVDRHGARDLIGEQIASGRESPVQPVRVPAEAAEVSVGLGVLIAEIRVRGLYFLRDDIGEVRRLLRILLRVGESLSDAIRHLCHRYPAHRASSQQQQDEECEADGQDLANRLELERQLHLASASVSSPLCARSTRKRMPTGSPLSSK